MAAAAEVDMAVEEAAMGAVAAATVAVAGRMEDTEAVCAE